MDEKIDLKNLNFDFLAKNIEMYSILGFNYVGKVSRAVFGLSGDFNKARIFFRKS